VPTLKLENRSKKPLYVMTGEVLTGAKQDRILAHDILIDPRRMEADIPVYCVESGRWTKKTENFSPAKNIATSKVRGAAQSKSSQGGIWDKVGKLNQAQGLSSSGSMQQSFGGEEAQKGRESYNKAMASLAKDKKVAGVVVAINGEIVSADVFGSSRLFAEMWPKLLDSYALEAWSQNKDKKTNAPGPDKAAKFLAKAFEANYRQMNNPGSGAEFLIESKDASGSVLVYNDKVVHMALFPFEGPKQKPDRQTALPPERWAEQTNQVQAVQNLMQTPADAAIGARSDSIKKDGMSFDIKNPGKINIKSAP